jgi:hypothetical protein
VKEPIFERHLGKPFPQSYWVSEGLLCVGCYPGDLDPQLCDIKLQGLLDCGIRRIVHLMEPAETSRGGIPFVPYIPRLQELARVSSKTVECLSFPIRDASAPPKSVMRQILNAIDDSVQQVTATYIHCWGGHGRTSTVIACYLIQLGYEPEDALDQVMEFRKDLPKNHYPFEGDQERFILDWEEDQGSLGLR